MTETVSSSETTDNIYETAHADGGIKLSWNVGQNQPDYTVQHLRKQPAILLPCSRRNMKADAIRLLVIMWM
jgi:hypothetical protein